MSYLKDPRVDAYIDALPAWQQEICQTVRDLVHEVDQEVVETVKRRVQPYFVLNGNICALLAAKDHVNVFLYDGAIVPDPEAIITGGHDNRAARTVAVRDPALLNRPALLAMFRQIVANNRAGGWRRIKAINAGSQAGARSGTRDGRPATAVPGPPTPTDEPTRSHTNARRPSG